jgi:hypothetical protein
VLAISGVVYGHWLLINLTYSSGRFSNLDTLDYVEWGRSITWAFQVMPVFFLAGGYANAHGRRIRAGRPPARARPAGCTVGLAATLLSGRDLAPGARQLQALSPQQPHQPPKAA